MKRASIKQAPQVTSRHSISSIPAPPPQPLAASRGRVRLSLLSPPPPPAHPRADVSVRGLWSQCRRTVHVAWGCGASGGGQVARGRPELLASAGLQPHFCVPLRWPGRGGLCALQLSCPGLRFPLSGSSEVCVMPGEPTRPATPRQRPPAHLAGVPRPSPPCARSRSSQSRSTQGRVSAGTGRPLGSRRLAASRGVSLAVSSAAARVCAYARVCVSPPPPRSAPRPSSPFSLSFVPGASSCSWRLGGTCVPAVRWLLLLVAPTRPPDPGLVPGPRPLVFASLRGGGLHLPAAVAPSLPARASGTFLRKRHGVCCYSPRANLVW